VMYMLWPDLDLETATHRLDRAVHNLRQVFEPGRSRPSSSTLLLTEYSTLVLAEQPQLWIDADAFEHLLTLARATDDPGEAEQLLEEAASLYNGEFLPEEVQVTAVLSRRETLRRGWVTLLLELADLRIEREAMPAAVEVLDRLLTTDPTNEAAAQRLIALLAQMGRRSEAITVYQRLAKALKQEFQISTLPETRTLFDTVLSGGDVPKPRIQTRRTSTIPTELAPVTRAPDTDHMHIGRTHQSPLVGRGEEMERLHNVLQITEQTRRLKLTGQKRPSVFAPLSLDTQRRAQFLTLMGDVGIGKTRLAEEAAREAKRRNWAVAWCRAYVQESNVPYRMWTEILRKAMSQGLWQRQELTRRPLVYQPLGMLMPELQDILPEVLYAPPLPPEQEKLRLWESTRALLSTICENTTLLIVLDDVQWADSSSCELLTYLVRQMRGAPVMFLCTCRDIELTEDHPLRKMMNDMTREQAIEVLPIKPLSHAQIRELIAHVPAPVVETISTRASGNPFFAEELARGVTVGDLLPAFDPLNPAELPETITAVLDLRLARITEKCQRLLERAAVLGDAFQFETICAMASGGAPTDEELILDLLEEGLQAGMLVEEGQGANITFTFWHPLLLSYLYEHLSAARRASLHRRAAQVMQEYYSGRESEGAAKITHHLVNGGGPRAHIAHFAELAADRSHSLSAYTSAEKHYRLVLEYLGPLAPTAAQPERLHYAYIHEQLGECTMIVGKFEAARTFYEQVLALRGQQQTFASQEERAYAAQLEALLWCEISRAWRYLGNGEQARASSTQSENVLHAAGVTAGPAWARIRYQQGHTFWLEGNLTEALALGHEALQRFKASQALPQPISTTMLPTQAQRILNGDPIGLGKVYTLLAGVEATLGQSVDALNHLNQALEVFEKNDIKIEIANVCCNLADLYLRRAEYTLARPMLMRSYKLTEEMGHTLVMSVALVNLGVLAARQGDLTEAETWYQQALDQIKQTSELFYTSIIHSYLATALIEQGKLDEAKPLLVQALKISHSQHIAPCTGFALVVLGQL
ncbi:MAG: tetratricopeptide repeat protein, partial [Ktedonobacteraceae bacterium]